MSFNTNNLNTSMNMIENYLLNNRNSFKINAKAKYFAKISTMKQLERLIKKNFFIDNKYIILGSGTNILFTDDFDGIVLKNNIKSGYYIHDLGDSFQIIAHSGIKFDDLIRNFLNYQIEKNEFVFGMENLAKIPGEIGSAVVQNIGAYGVEQKDFFECCYAINLKTCEIKIFNINDCNFDYRTSIFKQKDNPYFIFKVIYRINKAENFIPNLNYPNLKKEFENNLLKNSKNMEKITPHLIYNTVSKIRESKLPDINKYPNAGSFFKNPIITKKKFNELKLKHSDIVSYDYNDKKVKISAAWLIEECGFKGMRIGDVGVYENHSLILVNYKMATGQEVVDFANNIIKKVKQKFKITIYPEVVYV